MPDPLCWHWPVAAPGPSQARQAFVERQQAEGRTPEQAAILWELEVAADSIAGDGAAALAQWQDGRCAICGKARELVCDHDHETGLVRGWLCQSCNTTEGMNRDPDTIFARYRERPPVAILGIQARYLDPVTGEEAAPRPRREVDWQDKWTDAASEDIGL
ncbi:endonuclease domain-containing protein [Streptomyces cellulosae]